MWHNNTVIIISDEKLKIGDDAIEWIQSCMISSIMFLDVHLLQLDRSCMRGFQTRQFARYLLHQLTFGVLVSRGGQVEFEFVLFAQHNITQLAPHESAAAASHLTAIRDRRDTYTINNCTARVSSSFISATENFCTYFAMPCSCWVSRRQLCASLSLKLWLFYKIL